MKQLFLILILLVPVLAQSQFKENTRLIETDEGITVETFDSTSNPELSAGFKNQQYCLKKFHKSRITSRLMSFTGISLTTVGMTTGEEPLNAITGIGGLFSLIGIITHMSADRWLKRATIEPSKNGAFFFFNF